MVKIRLARRGAKKKPFYHIVIADARAKRDGRCIERIGSYAPLVQENKVTIDLERARYWISTGAQPTERVQKLMKEVEGAQSEISET